VGAEYPDHLLGKDVSSRYIYEVVLMMRCSRLATVSGTISSACLRLKSIPPLGRFVKVETSASNSLGILKQEWQKKPI